MRLCALLLGAPLLFAVAAADGVSPLSGTWRLDVNRSVLTGGLVQHRSTLVQALRISVSRDQVTVLTTTSGINGAADFFPGITDVQRTTEVYELDGQPRTLRHSPQDTLIRTASWLSDMRGFDVLETSNDIVKITQHWGVSADGQMLTVDYLAESPASPSNHRVLIFVRMSR